MINRIEGFLGVNKESEVIYFFLNSPVEAFIERSDVISALPSRDEALLGLMQKLCKRATNAAEHPVGDDSIEGVGDRERAGVLG